MTAPNVRRRNRLRLPLTAAVAALALMLGSCSALAPEQPRVSSADPQVVGDVPENLKDFYTQAVTWTSCNGGFQCSDVEVPIDYSAPDKASIKLSVIRLPATGKRQGAMLVNPGGPGGSGVDMVKDGGKSYFSEKLRELTTWWVLTRAVCSVPRP
ncbi:hypothetical protein NHF46_24930 [Arthrobacter alpinus]|nr:hypothetical protein [Arthrobacter alpinus]